MITKTVRIFGPGTDSTEIYINSETVPFATIDNCMGVTSTTEDYLVRVRHDKPRFFKQYQRAFNFAIKKCKALNEDQRPTKTD